MSHYETEHRARVAALESILTDKIRTIDYLVQNRRLSPARARARELTAADRPAEFQMEGYQLLGIIEGLDGNVKQAGASFEESRRIAVELEDYAHAAQTQEMLRQISDGSEAERYRDMRLYYEAEAVKRPAPERFRSFEIGHD